MKEAIKKYHSYYHLISGVDYPLKSQNYIHEFFKSNYGREFIRYDDNKSRREEYKDRVRYYYPFQEIIGRNNGKIPALCYKIQEAILWFQKKIQVDRIKNLDFEIYKGTNWFSITHQLAVYVIGHKQIIEQFCKYSLCADEIFLQTIAMISPYKKNIADKSLRYVDWDRGNPYTFTNEDYEELSNTDCLFARKFSEQKSKHVIEKIYRDIQNTKYYTDK